MKWTKLDAHLDADEIKGLIASGEQPNEIAQMLKMRYPKDKSKWLLHSYLYQYRKDKHPKLAERRKVNKYVRRQ